MTIVTRFNPHTRKPDYLYSADDYVYSGSFTNSDLSSGILSIEHGLDSTYTSVVIYDNNKKVIIPDDVTAVDEDNLTIDFSSYGTLTGTWNYVIISTGSSGASDHSLLSNLNWANSGHTIDSDMLPTASGTIDLGSRAYAFSEANVGVLRGDTGIFTDVYAGHSILGNNISTIDITSSGNITSTGTIQGVTLTDGTFSVTGGDITGATNTDWDAAYTHSQDSSQAHSDYVLNSTNDSMAGRLTAIGLTSSSTILPDSDNSVDIGATSYRFKHLYLGGVISDETNSLTVANAKSAYDHVSADGSSHSYIDQDVTSTSSPTFLGVTVTNAIDEFSTDGTLADDSDTALPTEKAVKTYVDSAIIGESPWERSGTTITTKVLDDDVVVDGDMYIESSGIFQNISVDSITASGSISIPTGKISLTNTEIWDDTHTKIDNVNNGWMYLQPSSTGSIVCFRSGTKGATEDGEALEIFRIEGTDRQKLKFHVDQYGIGSISYGNETGTTGTDLSINCTGTGDLRFNSAAAGDITCFDYTDIDNDDNGKVFYIYRKAAEKDQYGALYVDSYGNFTIKTDTDVTGDLILSCNIASSLRMARNVTIGQYISSNLNMRHYGYITAVAADKYVQWRVNDTTDLFELTREDSNILGFSVNMPFGVNTTTVNEEFEVGNSGRAFFGDGGGANRKGLLIDGNEGSGTFVRLNGYDYGGSAGLPIVLNSTGDAGVLIGTTDFDGTPEIGRLTIKGTTKDGSTNILVGRDSDEVNVFTLDTDGNCTLSGDITASGTFDDITMGNGNTIELNNELSSNNTITGITTTDTVGANVAIGDVLYMKSDGKYWLADADASTTMPAVVLAAETISADGSGVLIHQGYARKDSWDWTVGGLIYVSTSGATGLTLTQAAPSGIGDQVQVVGYAKSADIIYFDPSLVLVEVA